MYWSVRVAHPTALYSIVEVIVVSFNSDQLASINSILTSTTGYMEETPDGILCMFSAFSAEGRAIHARKVLIRYGFTVGDLLFDTTKGRRWDRAFLIRP
jgi:hypothetical protein